jgi:hypothetical protein
VILIHRVFIKFHKKIKKFFFLFSNIVDCISKKYIILKLNVYIVVGETKNPKLSFKKVNSEIFQKVGNSPIVLSDHVKQKLTNWINL